MDFMKEQVGVLAKAVKVLKRSQGKIVALEKACERSNEALCDIGHLIEFKPLNAAESAHIIKRSRGIRRVRRAQKIYLEVYRALTAWVSRNKGALDDLYETLEGIQEKLSVKKGCYARQLSDLQDIISETGRASVRAEFEDYNDVSQPDFSEGVKNEKQRT